MCQSHVTLRNGTGQYRGQCKAVGWYGAGYTRCWIRPGYTEQAEPLTNEDVLLLQQYHHSHHSWQSLEIPRVVEST